MNMNKKIKELKNIYPWLVAPDSAITPLSNIAAHEQTKNSKLWEKEKDQTSENLETQTLNHRK